MNKYLVIFYIIMLLGMAVCLYSIHVEDKEIVKQDKDITFRFSEDQ